MKYGKLTLGQIEAVVNKLGGIEGVRRFLRVERPLSESTCSWSEENGVVYFTVISNGISGLEWIKRLEEKGFRLSKDANKILCSSNFKPTLGITTEIAVLRGFLFEEKDRITKVVRTKAQKLHFSMPNAEVACLICERFTDEAIKAANLHWIIVMHDPFKNSDGDLKLLGVNCSHPGCKLHAYLDSSGTWGHDFGFAFAQQINTEYLIN